MDADLNQLEPGATMADPVAAAKMLIRCAADRAFDAFVQPESITQFWLKSTTGPLEAGATVAWEFLVPGATENVVVTECERPYRIAFSWTDGGLHVAIVFSPIDANATVVSVAVRGFTDDHDGEQAINATEGFAIVLCELKIFIESGQCANLVKDKAVLIANGTTRTEPVLSG
jgi:uncharacterized protein YndB with AHSA1/START domain